MQFSAALLFATSNAYTFEAEGIKINAKDGAEVSLKSLFNVVHVSESVDERQLEDDSFFYDGDSYSSYSAESCDEVYPTVDEGKATCNQCCIGSVDGDMFGDGICYCVGCEGDRFVVEDCGFEEDMCVAYFENMGGTHLIGSSQQILGLDCTYCAGLDANGDALTCFADKENANSCGVAFDMGEMGGNMATAYPVFADTDCSSGTLACPRLAGGTRDMSAAIESACEVEYPTEWDPSMQGIMAGMQEMMCQMAEEMAKDPAFGGSPDAEFTPSDECKSDESGTTATAIFLTIAALTISA